jgi:hypothetical protein
MYRFACIEYLYMYTRIRIRTHIHTPGDAAPLRVWELIFSTRNIGQTVPYPGAQNTLLITLALNTDIRFTTEFYNRWAVRISGLLGGPANSTLLNVTDATGGNMAAFFSAYDDGDAGSANYYGGGDPFSKHIVWSGSQGKWIEEQGGMYEKSLALVVQTDLRAGQLVRLAIAITNPVEPQESPAIRIDTLGVPLERKEMIRDSTTVLPGIFKARPGYAMPLK